MGTPQLLTGTFEDIPVVRPVGEFDFETVESMRTAVNQSLAADSRLILDLEAMTFADSSVLGLLAGSAMRAQDAGGWLRLVGPQRPIRRVLQTTSLDQVMPVFDTVELAATT